jgi:hypothetical protein
MSEIVAAIDETAAADVMHDAESALGTLSRSDSGSLGPFSATYSASATFSGGLVDLIPPDTIEIKDLRLDWTVGLSFSFDLSSVLPDIKIPAVCVDIPCVGEVCTPEITLIDWPTITIPVNLSDFVLVTGDFKLDISLTGVGTWKVDVVLLGIPNLQIGAASAALLTAIGFAAAIALAPIPFIGPFLALAVAGILGVIGIAGVTGLLGPILTPFVSGLRFTVYEQPQVFEILPSSGPTDPAVQVRLDSVMADVEGGAGEDELVVSIDISP